MLIAETSRTTRDDYWSADVGLSPGCGALSLGSSMSASGGGNAEAGSFVFGPGGGDVTSDPYDNVDDRNGRVDKNDNCWNAFSGFFDGNSSTYRLPTSFSVAAGDDWGTAAGSWRLKPDVCVSAVNAGGSCGSDGTTSPSCSPAESSTGSAA